MEKMKKANARGATEALNKPRTCKARFLEPGAIPAQFAPLMQFWPDALPSKSFRSR
jgi:hypothetical protein